MHDRGTNPLVDEDIVYGIVVALVLSAGRQVLGLLRVTARVRQVSGRVSAPVSGLVHTTAFELETHSNT